MGVFKALFAGIANFFKVLFGGLFKSVDDAEMTAPVAWKQADSIDAPSPAPVDSTSTPAPAAVAPTPVATSAPTAVSTEAVASEAAIADTTAVETVDPNAEIVVKELVQKEGPIAYASLNELATPRPNRRPGKSLSGFKSMVRDMQAAASQS